MCAAYVWRKGIDDLAREGFRELQNEENGELPPRNGRMFSFVRRLVLFGEQRRLLVDLVKVRGHDKRNGEKGRGEDGEKERGIEGQGETLGMLWAGEGAL